MSNLEDPDFFLLLFGREPKAPRNDGEDPRVSALREALEDDEPGKPGTPWGFRSKQNKTPDEPELI